VEGIMTNVYIVRSGMQKEFGWEWLNLRAFTDYDKAEEFMWTVEKQIPTDKFGVSEDVDIETLTLE
jgi:hypothetical protein